MPVVMLPPGTSTADPRDDWHVLKPTCGILIVGSLKNQRIQQNYPGPGPQTVWRGGRIIFDNVEDDREADDDDNVADDDVEDDDVVDDKVQKDDVEDDDLEEDKDEDDAVDEDEDEDEDDTCGR